MLTILPRGSVAAGHEDSAVFTDIRLERDTGRGAVQPFGKRNLLLTGHPRRIRPIAHLWKRRDSALARPEALKSGAK